MSAVRRRVLVADDDPLIRQVVATVLDLEEFEVDLAEDGDAALAAVLASPPDAVVLDQMMPGRTGLEVLAAMRKDERTKDIPVVILTAAVASALPVDPIDVGAQAHLAKPFSPLHLIEVLEGLMRAVR